MPKPLVGISRCLLGDEVRHDGGHKRNTFLVDVLGSRVEWVPVCPEVETGMGTPREPVHLVAGSVLRRRGRVRLVGVSSRTDWTSAMSDWARHRIEELASLELSGYILKADSPSCGLDDVPVVTGTDQVLNGPGLFAEALVEAFPDLPIEDERRLADSVRAEFFLARVCAYRRPR